MTNFTLTAKYQDSTTIILSWGSPTGLKSEPSYEIWEASSPAGPFFLKQKLNTGTRHFTIFNVTPVTHYYLIRTSIYKPNTNEKFESNVVVVSPRVITTVTDRTLLVGLLGQESRVIVITIEPPHINVDEDAATIDFELDPSWHVFPIIDNVPVDSGSANNITVPMVGANEYLVASTMADATAYWTGQPIVESVLDIYLNDQGAPISSTNFSMDWVLHESPFVGPQLIDTGKIYGDDSNHFSGGFAPLTGTPFETTTGSMVFSGSTFSVNFTASVGNLDIFETTTNNYIYPVATDIGAIHITGSPEFFGLYLPILKNTSGGLAQCESDPNFHTLYLPQITSSLGGFTIWFNNSLTSFNMFGLTLVSAVDLLQCNAVTEVLMPNLISCSGGDFSLNDNDNIQTVDIHNLRTIQGALNIGPNPSLASIDVSSLESTGEGSSFIINGSPLLTTIDVSSLTQIGGTFGGNFSVQGCGLDETTINAILAKLVAINFGVGTGFSPSVDLSQGTNASPTGQGLTDKQTLTDRGVTVTINPP